MKYSKHDAKAYAREHMTGIWAAALNPFNDDLTLDEAGLRSNIRHWIDDLGIQSRFVLRDLTCLGLNILQAFFCRRQLRL